MDITTPQSLLVFHPFMLLMFMAPAPVCFLLPVLQPLIINVSFVPLIQPPAVHSVLALIPVVIIPMIRIVYPMFALFALFSFVPLVIILWCGYRKSAQRCHQCDGYEY
jgi:hypothetical protein